MIIAFLVLITGFAGYFVYCVLDLIKVQRENNFVNKIRKKNTENTYGYLNFISDQEKRELIKFIKKNLNSFHVRNNTNELLCSIQDLPDFPNKLITKLRDRIINLENIGEHYPDIVHKDAISIIYDGGFHDYHRDINYLNWTLVRYNIILSKPDLGGLSVYGDEINDWDEKTIWKCVAGNIKHGVTRVSGDKERIVLCLGFLIPQQDVIQKQHKIPVNSFVKLPKEIEYLEVVD